MPGGQQVASPLLKPKNARLEENPLKSESKPAIAKASNTAINKRNIK
jgi:hypothetical protein